MIVVRSLAMVEEEGNSWEFCDFSLVMRKCHELRNVKFRTDCWGILHSIVLSCSVLYIFR